RLLSRRHAGALVVTLPHGNLRGRGTARSGRRTVSRRFRALRRHGPFDGRTRRAYAGAAPPGPLPLGVGLLTDRRPHTGALGTQGIAAIPRRRPRCMERARCLRADSRGQTLRWHHPGRPGRRRRIPARTIASRVIRTGLPGYRPAAHPAPAAGLRPQLLVRAKFHRGSSATPRPHALIRAADAQAAGGLPIRLQEPRNPESAPLALGRGDGLGHAAFAVGRRRGESGARTFPVGGIAVLAELVAPDK